MHLCVGVEVFCRCFADVMLMFCRCCAGFFEVCEGVLWRCFVDVCVCLCLLFVGVRACCVGVVLVFVRVCILPMLC